MSWFLSGLVARAAGLTAAPRVASPPAPEPAGEAAELVEEVEESSLLPGRSVEIRPEIPMDTPRGPRPAPTPTPGSAPTLAPALPPAEPHLRTARSETVVEPEPPPAAVPVPPLPVLSPPVPAVAPEAAVVPGTEEPRVVEQPAPVPPPPVRAASPETAVVAAGAEEPRVVKQPVPVPTQARSVDAARPRLPAEGARVFVPLPSEPQSESERPERTTVGAKRGPEPPTAVATPLPAAAFWPAEHRPKDDRPALDVASGLEWPEPVRDTAAAEPVDLSHPVLPPGAREPAPRPERELVEVHIGSIELTVAAPDPPTPERAPPQPFEPQGFDAYAAIR